VYTPIVSKLYDNIVKNFLLFYIICNDNEHVKIVRFLHGRQDWMTILKEKTVEEMMEEE